MSKSLIVILALTLGTSLAGAAFASGQQAGSSLQSNQAVKGAKTCTDCGRTLADYNIQKE
ncbi:MAG: hypothetical protein ABL936_15225 [Aestuariivirga sp.]